MALALLVAGTLGRARIRGLFGGVSVSGGLGEVGLKREVGLGVAAALEPSVGGVVEWSGCVWVSLEEEEEEEEDDDDDDEKEARGVVLVRGDSDLGVLLTRGKSDSVKSK